MAATIYPKYPPFLTSDQSEYLLANIKDWSILNGLAVRPSPVFIPKDVDASGSLAVTAPVTLFPSLFPRSCFEEARAIQIEYNELYALIAGDEGWLREIVEELIEVDAFIANLWDVHLAVKKEGYVQDLSLGLFRSDYMVHKDPSDSSTSPQIKQVEFNTIASSFGGLSSKVSALHSHLLAIGAYPPAPSQNLITLSSLPPNSSITSLTLGLATAHQHYGPSKSRPPLPTCILFIVQAHENNIFDQLALSSHLHSHHRIPTFRLPFPSILASTTIPSSNPARPLVYTPPHSPATTYEVTTLYFRAGYSPSEFSFPQAWPSRLHLERSAAIKSPSILTHLAGSKKIQQTLATPSSPHLMRFLPNASPKQIARIKNSFTAIYPLDSTPTGRHAISLAMSETECKRYVLKPQREGGGNNIYGAKIPPFLKSLGDDQRKYRAHILMKLIEPPALENSILRNGELKSGEVIGELGVYGVCLWRGNKSGGGTSRSEGASQGEGLSGVHGKRGPEILENWEAGYLLRTKGRESEEGGVAAGFGAVDSCCLVDV